MWIGLKVKTFQNKSNFSVFDASLGSMLPGSGQCYNLHICLCYDCAQKSKVTKIKVYNAILQNVLK